uniref:Uncharacterized protein n=1 Tax=Anolis carolinensis TaxID=28377 RepID=A0A803TQA8_ANOCA
MVFGYPGVSFSPPTYYINYTILTLFRIVADGEDRVEIEEDGELTSVLVNGKEEKPKDSCGALTQQGS